MSLARSALAGAAIAGTMLSQSETADAVPAFARQTGYYCSTCHTVQPELTPFGRQFKLNGYTAGGTRCGDFRRIFGSADTSTEWTGANLAAWMLPSFNHFAKPLPDAPGPGVPTNDIFDLTNASIFWAGQVYCDLGIFSQFSYGSTGNPDGTANIFLDNTELRYARKTNIAGNDVTWGVLGNNNPTMQDVWNTVPAWLYPWVPIDVASAGPPGTVIEGTFANRAANTGAYLWINSMFYVELSAIKGFDANTQKATGSWPSDGNPRLAGTAPYWRVAVEKTWNEQSLMFGTFGMTAELQPTNATYGIASPNPGSLAFPGRTDKYTDVAVDAQYQYIGVLHAFTARATYIWENQKLDATYYGGGPGNFASKADQDLRSFNISASYIYDRHISFTADYFNVQGSSDPVYWGTLSGRPNTDGVSFDLSYVPYPYGGPDLWPWLNARIGVVYTHFNQYNGTSGSFDGSGRNAKDNDQTFLYAWIDF